MKIQRRQHGFTLIELIAVIVILGILAAVALPKFADMSTNARMSKMNGAAGSMKAAVAMAHSLYLAAGTNPTSVTMEGQSVALVNGYPTAGAIATAAGLSNDYTVGTATGSGSGTGTISITPDTTKTSCTVTYTETNSTSTAPSVSASGVTATNC